MPTSAQPSSPSRYITGRGEASPRALKRRDGLSRGVAAGCAVAVSFGVLALSAGTSFAARVPQLANTKGPSGTTNGSAAYDFMTLGNPIDPTFNQLLGINDFGVIAGYYGSGSPAATHPNRGYQAAPYSANTFTNEDYPGSQQTQVTAINDWGNTVGFYVDSTGASYGFLDEFGP